MNIRLRITNVIKRVKLKLNPIRFARELGVTVGDRCRFIDISIATFGSEPYLVSIGDHVTLTEGVRFITHDGGVWVFREEYPALEHVAPISIGDNVFIGLNTILMPGVSVGNNCVIGAGSIVTRDIPDDSVAVGAPAKVVRSIEQYRTRMLEEGQMTRGMSAAEKRALHISVHGGASS